VALVRTMCVHYVYYPGTQYVYPSMCIALWPWYALCVSQYVHCPIALVRSMSAGMVRAHSIQYVYSSLNCLPLVLTAPPPLCCIVLSVSCVACPLRCRSVYCHWSHHTVCHSSHHTCGTTRLIPSLVALIASRI
jgi:hypothetical protein